VVQSIGLSLPHYMGYARTRPLTLRHVYTPITVCPHSTYCVPQCDSSCCYTLRVSISLMSAVLIVQVHFTRCTRRFLCGSQSDDHCCTVVYQYISYAVHVTFSAISILTKIVTNAMTASVYNCEYRFSWEMHYVRHCCDNVQSILPRVLVTIDGFWIG
jgi:hypothetical protein